LAAHDIRLKWKAFKSVGDKKKLQGCQIFLTTIYQNRENIQKLPTDHNIYEKDIKYYKWP
jgi:hypothetical protein